MKTSQNFPKNPQTLFRARFAVGHKTDVSCASVMWIRIRSRSSYGSLIGLVKKDGPGSGSSFGSDLKLRKIPTFWNLFPYTNFHALNTELIWLVWSDYCSPLYKSVILKMWYSVDFCRFLCEFPMILVDFCYPDPEGQNDTDPPRSGSTPLSMYLLCRHQQLMKAQFVDFFIIILRSFSLVKLFTFLPVLPVV